MNASEILRAHRLIYTLPHAPHRIYPQDISLKKGEITIMTGASGSGKTCFLDVLQNGLPLEKGTIHTQAKIVRIYQDLRLVREHSALRNVLDGLVGQRGLMGTLFPTRSDRKKALFWLNKLGLRHKAMQPVFSLSAGEAQRVAIARALIAKPMLLIADEPFSALDDEKAETVLSLLEQECATRGMAVLIMTHKVPRAEGVVPIRLTTFDPKLEKTLKNDPISKKNKHVSSLHHWSRSSSTFALLLFAVTSLLWLLPNLDIGNFSLTVVGHFFRQWVPTSSEFQIIPWLSIFKSLADTITMAVLATLLAVIFSLPSAIIATRGVMPDIVTLPVRYALNWWRAIPSIIWALVCVAAVGLGTLSGLFALVLYSMGYLTKFFYESFEQIDRKPAETLAQMGAKRSQMVLLALWPMTLRSILSSSLFMFEYNVRAASILGIVGAGGIGALLKESVEWSNWHVVGIIIFMMGFMVIAIDGFSDWLRRGLNPERKQKRLYG